MRRSVVLLLCAALLAACGGDLSGRPELAEPGDREPGPEIAAETLDGERLALADLEGPVIVNFWASWCGPCVAEAPELARLHEVYEGRVHVVGVNVKDNVTNAQRFEGDQDIPFPSWFDQAATIAADFGGVGPQALPSTIILDADHRVALRLSGAVTFAQVANYLEPLLAEAAASTS
ncbi:MAG: TlpA family protein disulfide reductase [Euzebyales bacterium]|jgi:thiol-disulfide isomerase/thioredoxin|nr:TlpA family protein disulfide reductase [Euzebyales bacterium]